MCFEFRIFVAETKSSGENMRKKILLTVALYLTLALGVNAAEHTLRVDYVFTGNATQAAISLRKMSSTDQWYGRTVNLTDVPVRGNGQIKMTDAATSEILYANSFSTLFQEWQATPEAKVVTKAFENTFLLPMPQTKANVTVTLFDFRGNVVSEFTHPVNPQDILIERKKPSAVPHEYIHYAGDPHKCIDVVIIAEGYTADQMDIFRSDAKATVQALFAHEPFASMKDRMNYLAVMPASEDGGVTIPRAGEWRQTPLSANFDTFYVERYLTTQEIFQMHDLLDGLPYEHIIILANTDTYGGGGIYNSYTLTTAHHPMFKPVVVHEFGHSFGALADEYAYAGEEDPYYFPDCEPWEQNITTRYNFASKWQDMIDAGIKGVGLFEGAGYQPKGVWRPVEDCRMRTNQAEGFCPVCQRAIERIIRFNTEAL